LTWTRHPQNTSPLDVFFERAFLQVEPARSLLFEARASVVLSKKGHLFLLAEPPPLRNFGPVSNIRWRLNLIAKVPAASNRHPGCGVR